MPGPSVQHGDLEADPAQVFGKVFAGFGFAVQADDQLIAVDAVGTRKLEEGSQAVWLLVMNSIFKLVLCRGSWAGLTLTQASNPVP